MNSLSTDYVEFFLLLVKITVAATQVLYLAFNFCLSHVLQFFFHSRNLCRLLINSLLQLHVFFFQQINLPKQHTMSLSL